MLIDLIETIEVSIKTKVAYHIAHTYSPVGHLNFQNFDEEERHAKFLNILKTEQRHMKKNVQYIKHNVKKYGELPIWIAIEFLSLGTVSYLFENMLPGDKKYISKEYFNLSINLLESWLHSISNVRNRCAHHLRIYNTFLTFNLKLDKDIKKYKVNNKSLFAVFIALKKMLLNEKQWKRLIKILSDLFDEYSDVIELERMGFPCNWLKILKIEET